MPMRVNQDKIDEIYRKFTSEIRCYHNKPQEKTEDSSLSEEERKILYKNAMELGVELMSIYKDLNLHPAKGKKAVSELEAKKYG